MRRQLSHCTLLHNEQLRRERAVVKQRLSQHGSNAFYTPRNSSHADRTRAMRRLGRKKKRRLLELSCMAGHEGRRTTRDTDTESVTAIVPSWSNSVIVTTDVMYHHVPRNSRRQQTACTIQPIRICACHTTTCREAAARPHKRARRPTAACSNRSRYPNITPTALLVSS
jgi:hypothetical protein